MAKSTERLRKELAALPVSERYALAEYLIDSADNAKDAAWEDSWMSELDRRWAAVQEGRSKGVAASTAFKRARQALENLK